MGGVRDKVLAARRGGIRHILLPSRNRGDLEEVPSEVAEGLRFTFVESIGDVLFALFPAGHGIDVSPEEEQVAAAAGDEAGGAGAGGVRSAAFQSAREGPGGSASLLRQQGREQQRQQLVVAGETGGAEGGSGSGWEGEYVSGVLLESFL